MHAVCSCHTKKCNNNTHSLTHKTITTHQIVVKFYSPRATLFFLREKSNQITFQALNWGENNHTSFCLTFSMRKFSFQLQGEHKISNTLLHTFSFSVFFLTQNDIQVDKYVATGITIVPSHYLLYYTYGIRHTQRHTAYISK